MKSSLVVVMLLALLQPGLAPAAQTLAPAPEPATAEDCPHTMDTAPGANCEHDGCDCSQTCSSALSAHRQAAATAIPRPARVHRATPGTRTGFRRTPFRPPSS